MIRQNIILGDYIFVADLYKAHVDIKDNIYKSEWVMLRHFDVMNTIAYDTDIYFIERSVIKEALKEIHKKNSSTSRVVFPTLENKYTGYSSNYKDFNDDYNYYTFKLRKGYTLLDTENNDGLFKLENEEDEENVYIDLDELTDVNTDIYNLINENGLPTLIECDTVRLYHPICIKKLDTIIYMDNYINNIHFHYYCQKYDNLKTNSETEFEAYHNRYSEFVEFHIPNIEFLFGEGNVYFNEDLNLVSRDIKENHESGTIWDNKLWETYKTEIVSDAYNNYFFKIKTETGQKTAQFSFKESDLKLLDNPSKFGEYKTLINGHKENEFYDLYYSSSTNKYTLIINDNCNLIWDKTVENRIPADYNYVSYVYWDSNSSEGQSDIYYQKQILTSPAGYNLVISDSNIIPLNTLLLPFTIEKNRDVNSDTYGYYIKNYIEEKKNIWTNYISWPINLTLYPYEYIDDKTDLYILDSYLNSNSDTFQLGCRFELSSKLGFSNGIISIINRFKYPNNILYKFDNIKDAYKFYNNVTEEDYTEHNLFFKGNEKKDEDEVYESSSNIKYCGYAIEIASDIRFTNIIYQLEENLEFIDDFAFNLNGLFDLWEEMPEVLVIRSKFIDKYLCNTIFSNFVVITKEWFKYLINHENVYRLDCLVNRQEHVDETGKRRYLYWDGQYIDDKDNIKYSNGPTNVIWNKINKSLLNTTEDMNTDYFNYIDKVNCIIKTKEKDDNLNLSSKNTQQILYRPVFYKVADGQNIRIRESLTQNIGINLGGYLNKVDTFYLYINGLKYEEFGRNDIFVIFRINAIDLTNVAGKYDITDGDGEYITTGRWAIY